MRKSAVSIRPVTSKTNVLGLCASDGNAAAAKSEPTTAPITDLFILIFMVSSCLECVHAAYDPSDRRRGRALLEAPLGFGNRLVFKFGLLVEMHHEKSTTTEEMEGETGPNFHPPTTEQGPGLPMRPASPASDRQ